MSKLHEFRSIHKKNISQFYLNEIFDPFCCIWLLKRHIQMFTWNLHCIKILENVEKVDKTL